MSKGGREAAGPDRPSQGPAAAQQALNAMAVRFQRLAFCFPAAASERAVESPNLHALRLKIDRFPQERSASRWSRAHPSTIGPAAPAGPKDSTRCLKPSGHPPGERLKKKTQRA